MNLPTYTMPRTGDVVLCNPATDYPLIYMSRAQAEKAAAKRGAELGITLTALRRPMWRSWYLIVPPVTP